MPAFFVVYGPGFGQHQTFDGCTIRLPIVPQGGAVQNPHQLCGRIGGVSQFREVAAVTTVVSGLPRLATPGGEMHITELLLVLVTALAHGRALAGRVKPWPATAQSGAQMLASWVGCLSRDRIPQMAAATLAPGFPGLTATHEVWCSGGVVSGLLHYYRGLLLGWRVGLSVF